MTGPQGAGGAWVRRIPTPIAQRLSGIVTNYRTLQLTLDEVSPDRYREGLRSRDPRKLKSDVYPLERAFEVAANYVVELVRLGLRELGIATADGPTDLHAFRAAGAISQRLCDQLVQIHRARNDLAHDYPDLRASAIYEASELQIKVIPVFLREYTRWLRAQRFAAPTT